MSTLKGHTVYLRALEPEDLELVHRIENDESVWELSHTQVPFSKFLIRQYIQHADQDIYEAKQLRLAISNYEGITLGFIDLFDFDFKNHRAGIGIILTTDAQGKGYASEALRLLINYSFTHLNLHQLYCSILEENLLSQNLFKKAGFQKIGLKKDWIFVNGLYKNELLFQRLKQG